MGKALSALRWIFTIEACAGGVALMWLPGMVSRMRSTKADDERAALFWVVLIGVYTAFLIAPIVLAGVAAWGLHRRTSWARGVAIAASAAHIVLFFPLTIFGLVVLLRKGAGDLVAAPAPGKAKLSGAEIAGAVVLGILLIGGFEWAHHVWKVEFPPAWYIFGTIPVMVFLSTAFHELGHLLFGWANGMTVSRMAAGPVVWHRGRFHWAPASGWAGGFIEPVIGNADHLTRRLVWMLAGGPAGSFVFGGLCLWGLWAAQSASWSAWAMPLVQGMAMGFSAVIINLTPLNNESHSTDGDGIRELLRGGPRSARKVALMGSTLSSTTPLRPREWGPEHVAALESGGDVTRQCGLARFDLYRHLLDAGHFKGAELALREVMDLFALNQGGGCDCREQALEACWFLAFHLGDRAGAEVWWRLASVKVPVDPWLILRAEAALSEHPAPLIQAAREWLAQEPATGLRAMELDLLAAMERRLIAPAAPRAA